MKRVKKICLTVVGASYFNPVVSIVGLSNLEKEMESIEGNRQPAELKRRVRVKKCDRALVFVYENAINKWEGMTNPNRG